MPYTIDTDIPYGNACDVEVTTRKDITEISFTPDPHGGPEALWFCFRIARTKETKAGRHLRLVLKNPINLLGGYAVQHFRPVVRYENGDWQRLGAPHIEELPDGRAHAAWEIDALTAVLDVAFCYPYGKPEIEALLADTNNYWHSDTIGVSQQARPLMRLSNGYGELESTRPGLYLVARQHSGETSGSWVLDGLLRQLATYGDEAPLTWVIPLADIDGIERGDYGKDNFPYDLNRAWGRPPMRHETRTLQLDINRWSHRCKPALVLDFHSPAGGENEGFYFHLPLPDQIPVAYRAAFDWSEPIKAAMGETYARPKFETYPGYKSRWDTPMLADFITREYGITCLALEAPYALANELVLTRGHYREVGARMAKGIVEKLGAAPR